MASRKELGSRRRGHLQSHSKAEKPLWHFFKIIVKSNLKDKKLKIPDKFVRKYGDELSEVAKVVVPNGPSWQIGLTKANNHIWFDDGWQTFLEHNSIGYGHVLVFGYNGFSNFSVLVFDKTACEIQYRLHRGETSGPDQINYDGTCLLYDVDVMGDEGPVESMDSQYRCALENGVFDENAGESSKRCSPKPTLPEKNANDKQCFEPSKGKRGKRPVKKEQTDMADLDDTNESKRRKLSNKSRLSSPHESLTNETKDNEGKSKTDFDETEMLPQCEEHMEIVVTGFSRASQESKRAIHAARMFKPKNPSVMILLRPYNKCFVSLPSEFAKRHLTGIPEYIKLQVSDGRQWPVRLNRTQRNRVIISKGWNEFRRENNLKEGDVCVFELIKNYKLSLKVSMFRVVDDSGPSN